MRRWPVVVGALMVQACLGAIYAWGTFVPMFKASQPQLALMLRPEALGIDPDLHAGWMTRAQELKKGITGATGTARDEARTAWSVFLKKEVEPNLDGVSPATWTRFHAAFSGLQTKAIFATALAVFSLVMIGSGRLQDRVGPRPVALAGCLLLGLGYFMASRWVTSFAWVLGWIGVVGGAGIGFAYVCPIAACLKWFPEAKGTITGLAVAGFGAGAYLFINLAGTWAGWLNQGGLPLAFQAFALIFLSVGMVGALLLSNPPAPEHGATIAASPSADPVGAIDLSQGKIVRTGAFWKTWAAFMLSSGAGLMVIGSLKDFGVNEGGLSEGAAEQALGLLAVFNGLGRLTWGALGERWGVRPAMVVLMALQVLMLAALPGLGANVVLLALAGCGVGFQFGGSLATFPLLTAERFGLKHLGGNYGLVFTAYGVGGVVGPILAGSVWDNLKSYQGAFAMAALACALATALLASLPRQPRTRAEA